MHSLNHKVIWSLVCNYCVTIVPTVTNVTTVTSVTTVTTARTVTTVTTVGREVGLNHLLILERSLFHKQHGQTDQQTNRELDF